MSKTASEAARHDWLCHGCNFAKPGYGPIDVTIQNPGPEDAPLNFVYGFGVPIAKRTFLESFGDEVLGRDLLFGRVFVEGGSELADWVSFRGQHSLIIRGSKNVSYRKCPECRRNVYFAMGATYLFPTPPSGCEMFDSDLSGLVVSQRLFNLLKLNQWPKLVIEKLPVLGVPNDGLPEIVSTYSLAE